MALTALQTTVDSIRARGTASAAEIQLATSRTPQGVGKIYDAKEHAVLVDLRDRMVRGEVKGEAGAAELLTAFTLQGPDTWLRRTGVGLLAAVKWLGIGAAATIGATYVAGQAGNGHGMEGLAVVVGTMLIGGAATGVAALVAGVRAAMFRD